ncbi:unnamed protein product [Calypogeia fissa]
MAQYASDEEVDWATLEGVLPNPIFEDEEDDQADEEREVRQAAREQMASVDPADPVAEAPHVNRALFDDVGEDDEGILSGPYVFSSQGPSQQRVDEAVEALVQIHREPPQVVFDPVRVHQDVVVAAEEHHRDAIVATDVRHRDAAAIAMEHLQGIRARLRRR